jgi:hypothetical protein
MAKGERGGGCHETRRRPQGGWEGKRVKEVVLVVRLGYRVSGVSLLYLHFASTTIAAAFSASFFRPYSPLSTPSPAAILLSSIVYGVSSSFFSLRLCGLPVTCVARARASAK